MKLGAAHGNLERDEDAAICFQKALNLNVKTPPRRAITKLTIT